MIFAVTAKNETGATFRQIRKDVADLKKGATDGGDLPIDMAGLDKFAGGLSGLLSGGGLAALGMGAGVAALGAVGMAMAETGAQAEALEASFQRMAMQSGQSGSDMLAAMQQASGGMIANQDLMLSANRAMSFGVADNAAEMTQLIQVAMAQAAKMGIPVQQAFNDLVTGVGRLSPMILDNLGVTVKAETAYANYAASIGKSADALTQAEQRQAFLNEMMAAVPNAAEEAEAAANTNAAAWDRWNSSIQNLGDSVGKLLSGPGANLLEWLNAPVAGINGLLNPSDIQKTNSAMVETARQIDTVRREIEAAQGSFRNLGMVAGETMPIDITMPAPMQYEPEVIVSIENLEQTKAELLELEATLNRLRETQAQQIFGYAPDPEPWANILAIGDEWAAQQAEMAAQAATTAAAIAAAYDGVAASMTSQIGSLTKGLIDDMGALAALDLNDSLIAEMTDLIAAYEAAGISAETVGYLMVEWLNKEAEAARNAAAGMKTLAGATSIMAGRQAAALRSVSEMNHMLSSQVGLFQRLGRAARGASAGAGEWELPEPPTSGLGDYLIDAKDAAEELNASLGGGGGGGGTIDALDTLQSKVESLLSGSLNVDVGVDSSAFLPREDALNEDARRLADVMVNGFSSPWASYFQTEFPELFAQMTAGGDIQAGAAQMLREFEQGLRPELINQDLVKERVKAMIVGDANMAALAAEITGELQAELAGMDPAQISGLVNGALGIQETGVGAGIEDELGNAALLGKIQGTGTTAGKSWGQAFLAYVESNVPATLVGLLVDLVTPGVRAKINADASAEGAT